MACPHHWHQIKPQFTVGWTYHSQTWNHALPQEATVFHIINPQLPSVWHFITLHSYFLQFPCTGVNNSFRPFFNNKYRNRGILRNIQFPSGIKTKFGPTFYVLYICGVIILISSYIAAWTWIINHSSIRSRSLSPRIRSPSTSFPYPISEGGK